MKKTKTAKAEKNGKPESPLLDRPLLTIRIPNEEDVTIDPVVNDDQDWADSFGRSFHPDRAPDVTVKLRENQLLRPAATGTGHGSPYRYDTHVPMIFFGAGINAGQHSERVRTTDIAPTLAHILGIAAPNGLDGRDLYESIR